VRAVGVVVVDPASEHDPSLGERVELLAVEELAASASVERLDEAVLPGRAGAGGLNLGCYLYYFDIKDGIVFLCALSLVL